MKRECVVKFIWDDEAQVWFTDGGDLRGLILEADSVEKLMKRVISAAPELIELNNLPKYDAVKFEIEKSIDVTTP